MGDLILTLPLIKILQEEGAFAVDLLVNRSFVSLLEQDPAWALDDPKLASFFIRGERPAADWRDYFRRYHTVISYLSDPDEIFALHLRAAGVQNFIRAPHQVTERRHATEQLIASPLRALKLPVRHRLPEIPLLPAVEKLGQRSNSLVVVHPGSGSRTKNWAIENWISLLRGCLEKNRPVLVVGGEADQREIASLRQAFDSGVAFAVNQPLTDLASRLAQAAIFVGHDSGVSHLAAAVRTKCLLLFGPTDPAIWAPLGEHVTVLRSASTKLEDLSLTDVLHALDRIEEKANRSAKGSSGADAHRHQHV